MSRRSLHRFIPFRFLVLVAPLVAAWPQSGRAANVLWNNATSQAWQTPGNWTGGALPGSADVAQFGATGTATAIGSSNNVTIQALQILAARTADLTIGNSSTTTNYTMTLNGGTVNGVANTVLSYERAGGTLNINNTAAGGSGTGRSFNVTLANATDNIFNVAGGTVNMNTIIGQSAAGRRLTKDGAGVLVLAAANTFSGPVTVRNSTTAGVSTLRVQNSTGLGTGTTVNLLTGGAAGGQGTTLDIRNGITVAAGKTLTLNSNTTGDLRSTLLNGANNNTWNSNIVAAGTGLVQINAAGGTTLTIGGGVTSSGGAGTGTLFTRGAGTVIYNGVINLGSDRVFSKTDAGTVIVNSTGNSWVRTQVANGQIQIGADDALAVGRSFMFGEGNANNGRLELNGFSQTVGGISTFATSTATNHILRNSNTGAPSTLTFATPAATTDLLRNVNVIGTANGGGVLHMVSNGSGRTEFQDGPLGADSWTVNSGTVAFTGNANRLLPGTVTGAAGAVIEKTGTGTLAVQGAWNHAGTTNIAAGTLTLGAGTSGAVNVADGASLGAGLGGGVFTSSAVTFGTAGATNYVPMLTAPAVAAPLNAGALTANGAVTVTPLAGSFSTGTYRLLDYAGTIGGAGSFALGPVGSYPHMTASLNTATPGQVNLVVSAVDSLIWTGNTSGVWDTNTTPNFALASSSGTPATFYVGDAVAFGDTHDVGAPGTPVTNSTITGGAITAGNLTFNNSAVNYSVANAIGGAGGVTKTGTGTVTLSGANSYGGPTNVSNGTLVLSGASTLSGNVNVTGGTLRIGNADALRGVPMVSVSGGGTFDANGTAVGNRFTEIQFAGTGVGGTGAIVNNGAGVTNNSHFQRYTMTGDATWGGSGRYDVVTSQLFNAGGFSLTKVGNGQLWFNPGPGSTTPENVIVNGGQFGSQGNNPLTATATVTVNNGSIHQFFGSTSAQHSVVLNDGGILRSTGGSNTLSGQVTLNGADANRFIQATSGTALNVSGQITGTGGFTVNDAGTVQLQNAANDYAGDTVINAGTLNFNATGAIPATTNLVVNGGTFATGNIPRTIGSLSGNGGTINGGNVVTTNQSTTTTWNGVLSGTTLQMSGTGSLTLGGTADNVSGSVTVNSGTVVFAKGNTAQVAQAVHTVGGGLTINGGTLQLAGSYNNSTSLGTGVNLAPGGFDPATYVDQIYNAVTVNLNGGTMDLNGRQEAINGLVSTGSGGTLTNTSAAPAKLYVGYQGATSTFGGSIDNGAGTVAVEKIGTGTLTLTGISNFTGGLVQATGNTALAAGAVLGNTPITVTSGTFTLDGTHGTGAIALNGTSTFAGAGTSGGTLTAATGTTVRVGTASIGLQASTLTLGGLTLGGGVNLNLDFTGSAIDKVATTAANGLTLNGVNSLNVVLGAGWVSGTYPIFTYAGTLQGTGVSALALTTPTGHSTVNIVDNGSGTVNLVVASTPNKWVGNVNSTWDTGTTTNWNASDNLFLEGDTVIFDDTATTFTPNIAANQTPAGVTFNNTTPYTLTSSTSTVGIAGAGGLIKTNTGTVTISSANTYTGTTDVQAGTLIANYNNGTATTVFAAASTINVAAGATFKAVANDSNFTLANNLTGSGTVVIDPHFTAAAGVRDVAITGNNAGFTGTLQLAPTTDVASGLGTFRTNAQLTPARAGGATIDVNAGAQAWINNGTFANNFIITGHGYAETAGGTPAAVSGLTAYTGAVPGGIGALRMDNGAVITGNVTLDGSAKIMPYNGTGTIAGSIGTTNATDILSVGGGGAGSTLILTGTNNAGSNPLRSIVVNAGGTSGTNVLQVGNLGTTGTLGTGDVTLYTDGAGAQLRIQRSDGYTMMQNVTAVHNGTAANLTKATFVANTQGTGLSLNGHTIDLTDGTTAAATAGTVHVAGVGNANGVNNAILNIDGSSIVRTGQFFIGEGGGGFSGTVNQSGTSSVQVNSHMRVGHWPNNTSVYNLSGGTFATTPNPGLATNPFGGAEVAGGIYLGVDGTGVMNQSGGTVTTDWVVLDNRLNNGPGTNQPDGIDRYNLSGGTLELRSQYGIHQRHGTSEFNFTGGTIRNVGSGVNVTISAGSGGTGDGAFILGTGGSPTFDSGPVGNAITISRSMSGSGSLTKVGNGVLNLAAGNSFTGGTFVNGGTLVVDGDQVGDRLSANHQVTVQGTGSVFEVRGVNALPTGGNAVDFTAEPGGTVRFVSGGSGAIGAGGESHAHVRHLNLNGGAVELTYSGTGAAYDTESFILNGTLTSGGSALSEIRSLAAANVSGMALGGTAVPIVVANAVGGVDLRISAEIEDPRGSAGGFVKQGPGTLELTGANSYSGGTVISEGTVLANNTTGSATGSGPITVAPGATLGGSGFVSGLVTTQGTLSPGNSIGSLTLASAAGAGTFLFEYDGAAAGQKIDFLTVTGNWDISAATLDFDMLGASLTDLVYEFAAYGSLTGAGFANVVDVPAGYSLNLNYGGAGRMALVSAAIVPEPGAAAGALVAGAGMVGLVFRRRRRVSLS